MKTTIDTAGQFRDQFTQYGRKDQFSYEALGLLFDYFEDCDPDMELDVVAICCEYYEDTPADIANNYWDRDSVPDDEDELRDQVREYLEANTSIVGETATGFVYAVF
jgi:hypothetical protein